MLNKTKVVLHIIWAVFAITFATTLGASVGWENHGIIGAIAVGFIGFCVGGLIALSPMFLLEMLH
ncbi:hypothetical protein UNPF46_32230 [Bradyrhizobium sp. UNPF46]|nr:hypothetical protein UNPF46_32230 [Bradyrhizobium sp. UNPF46]